MKTFFTQIFNSRQTKSLFSFVTLNALALTAALAQVANNPKANDKAVVTCGNARFTVLTPEMIRIEYSDKAAFEDRATFTVVNRNLTVPQFTKKEDSQYLYITTSALELKYRKGSDPRTVPASSANLSVVVKNHTGKTTWYPGKPDPLNLKGTCRTLDGLMGEGKRSEMENGLVSSSTVGVPQGGPLSSLPTPPWATTGGQNVPTVTPWTPISWAMATTTSRHWPIIRK